MGSFKFVELFAGIGGFRQGLTPLGGECVMAAEWDKYASQAYTILYGGDHLHGDVTKINENDVPDHDLLVFGMPCQAFSVAGKRLGFEDMRGTLYFEAMRIAKAKKPKALWMENVKGLIGHDGGRTLEVMAQAMSDIGYTIDLEVMNSKYFGVPQNRERIFMIGIRDDLVETAEWNVGKRSDVVAKGKRRIKELGVKTFNFDWPAQESVTVRLRDILESDVDEKFYLSEEKTAKLVAQLEGRNDSESIIVDTRQHIDSREGKGARIYEDYCPALNATEYKEPKQVAEPQMLGHIDLKGHDAIKRVYSAEGVSPTLTTMGGGHREPKIAELQGLAIREATKQGYAIAQEGDAVNFQFPDSNTRRGRIGKQMANTLEASGINQGVVQAEVRSVGNTNPSGNGMNGQVYDIDAGLSPTLTTNKGEGPKVADLPRYRIRKLTPRECFRLQGFPDAEFDKLTANGISNSQLYKMAGNAVTVNVISALGKRLTTYITQ
jgi:DNA (cytosine-5)-methyltransferase 1